MRTLGLLVFAPQLGVWAAFLHSLQGVNSV
jgi:hypothetical protein